MHFRLWSSRRPLPLALSLGLLFTAACGSLGDKGNSSGTPSAAKSAAADALVPNLKVGKYILSNGLRVLIVENPKLDIFSYYTFFDVGGRHEERTLKTTGATHFLEHMMFKGTNKFPAGTFDTIIEGNGGSTNAYTSFDSTVYYENMPTTSLKQIIEMEADRMQDLLLDKEAFESERQVVLEERKYRYENSPQGQLYLAMMQAVFQGTPYGGSVIGDESDLLALTRDQLMEFFKQFYRPDNAVVVVAGAVDAGETLKMIKAQYGDIAPSTKEVQEFKKSKDDPKRFEHQAKEGQDIRLKGQNPEPMFAMAFKGEPVGTQRSFAMDLLSSVIGDGESSYLNQTYVKATKPLMKDISAANYTLKYNGAFYIMGELVQGVSLDKIKQMLVKDNKLICQKAINERSLQKTKNQYLINYFRDIQTNAGVAHFLGLRETFFGDYAYYQKELEIYNAITVDELKKVCESVFSKAPIFVSVWDKYPAKKTK